MPISAFSGGISNSGRSRPATAGIPVGNSAGGVAISTFSGGITNSGTINAKTGIAIENVTFGGGITASGVIAGFANGILIVRLGTVSSSDTGILVNRPTFTGGIGNSGTVSAGGNGIFVGGKAFTAPVFSAPQP